MPPAVAQLGLCSVVSHCPAWGQVVMVFSAHPARRNVSPSGARGAPYRVGCAKKNRRRFCRRRFLLVEAAGQLFHLFRGGLDYAFIPLPGCGACYPPLIYCRVDPSAGSGPWGFSRSMSLYRAGLRLALFLPLGVAIPPPGGCRVRRCEPRFHSTLAGRGDHCVNRTRVRKLSALGSTCLARSSS